MLTRLLNSVGRKPTQAIEYLLGVFTAFVGVFILSPWYQPIATPTLHNAVNSEFAIKTYAIILLLAGGLTLFALAKSKLDVVWLRVRARISFFYFIYFCYFGLAGMLFAGFTSLSWVSSILLALIAGVVYLRLKWENK